jgi:DNA invertase Pin-like site-specific DNA recombinase
MVSGVPKEGTRMKNTKKKATKVKAAVKRPKTVGPMGRMFITLVGSIAELERSLIVERIRAGMRRARMEGRRLGRAPLSVDRNALVRDRLAGMSLTDVAKKYRISRASVVRVVRDAKRQMLAAA